MKYRKKPVFVEAIQFNGSNHEEMFSFNGSTVPGKNWILGEDDIMVLFCIPECPVVKVTGTYYTHLTVGDWIIKDVKGEFYPCKSDIFEQTYSPAESGLTVQKGHLGNVEFWAVVNKFGGIVVQCSNERYANYIAQMGGLEDAEADTL